MSDRRQEIRNWRLYIQDMIEFGQRVLNYTEGLDQDDFVADERTYDATLRNIELLARQQGIYPATCAKRIRKLNGVG